MGKRAGLLSLCIAVAGLAAGCQGVASPAIQTGRADVNAAGDGGSITTPDWTYSLPTDGIVWIDRAGGRHDAGRPDCLPPGASTEVRFAAIETRVADTMWRPVVWLSCQ